MPAGHERASSTAPCLAGTVGGLSHALDMAEGHTDGHALRSCWIGMHIGAAIGLPPQAMSDLYYTLLLKDLGGSSNASHLNVTAGVDDIRFKRTARLACGDIARAAGQAGAAPAGSPIGTRLRALLDTALLKQPAGGEATERRTAAGWDIARQMGFPDAVARGIRDLDEHWDGSGHPSGRAGAAISPHARIALLAQVIDEVDANFGSGVAVTIARRRGGSWFDPALVSALCGIAARREFWSGLHSPEIDMLVLGLEPQNHIRVADEATLDAVADGFGRVIDAKSAYTTGHSRRVAETADMIASAMGVSAARRRMLSHAARLHDIGMLGVPTRILDKPGRLGDAEWRAVQDHCRAGAAILSRAGTFPAAAEVAATHHERPDGHGYPRGIEARHLDLETRIVTVAGMFAALTEARPYRDAMPEAQALAIMTRDAGGGLDGRCLDALARAPGRSSRIAA